MVLADKLYKLRKAKNISQDKLALELEISKTALMNWENNKSKPSIDNLLKICDFFETDIYTLLEDVSNINFSNAQFKGHSYAAYAQNFTVNNAFSPEIVQVILENQSKINSLFEQQNQLFEKIFDRK